MDTLFGEGQSGIKLAFFVIAWYSGCSRRQRWPRRYCDRIGE